MAKLVSTRGAELLLSKNQNKPSRFPYRTLAHDMALPLPDDSLTPGGLVTEDDGAEAHPDGIDQPTHEITKMIEQALANKFHSTYSLRLGDSAYYLPTLEEVNQIVHSTRRARRSWIAERYDCDDFAYVLKAYASSVAYINNELRLGLCCGIVWGKFRWISEFHACNWVITADRVFRLIEPQDDNMYPESECMGSVTFVAA